MAEKEEEEARAVLEQATRSRRIKLPAGDKLDKTAILNQVGRRGSSEPLPWAFSIEWAATFFLCIW